MRLLGSYFHIAMNGMAASEKIFKLLDLPEPKEKAGVINPENCAGPCAVKTCILPTIPSAPF